MSWSGSLVPRVGLCRTVHAGALLAAMSFASLPALANGGDFFAEMQAHFEFNPEVGPQFFGFIRDENGRVVPNAVVSATIHPSGSGMIVHADVLGHYRIPGFSKHIDPATVEISCSKPGYRQVAAHRRVRTGDPNTPIETTCMLAPDTDLSS